MLADGGWVLRGWSPERGLSLDNFVGLVAERRAISILRSGRRSPWREDPTLPEDLDPKLAPVTGEEPRIADRQLLAVLLDRLRARLSPQGLQLFEMLFVEQQTVEEISAATGRTANAIYIWRSRLASLARELAADLATEGEGAARSPSRESARETAAEREMSDEKTRPASEPGDLLEQLAALARRERAAGPDDPRLDALLAGGLGADEEAALLAEAAHDPELAAAVELFRPLDAGARARFADRVLAEQAPAAAPEPPARGRPRASTSWAWATVIAAMFTTLRAEQSRSSTFTGLRMPMRIGPARSAPPSSPISL